MNGYLRVLASLSLTITAVEVTQAQLANPTSNPISQSDISVFVFASGVSMRRIPIASIRQAPKRLCAATNRSSITMAEPWCLGRMECCILASAMEARPTIRAMDTLHEGISVIGGFVYRGSLLPDLLGKYVFGEFSGSNGGRLFAGDLLTGEVEELTLDENGEQLDDFVIKGFGQNETGELFVLASQEQAPFRGTGVAFQIVAKPTTGILAGLAVFGLLSRRRSFSG